MGRPREFDPEEALLKMIDAFWAHGYEGASMQVLEKVTGLKKQSLYRIYGEKRAMYLAALEKYERLATAERARLMPADAPLRAQIEALLSHYLDRAAEGDRRGCFLVNAAIDQAPHDPPTDRFVKAAFRRIEHDFATALAAHAPWREDAEARRRLARKLMTGYAGFRALCAAGLPADALQEAAHAILSDVIAAGALTAALDAIKS